MFPLFEETSSMDHYFQGCFQCALINDTHANANALYFLSFSFTLSLSFSQSVSHSHYVSVIPSLNKIGNWKHQKVFPVLLKKK